ncbi:MAG: permease [Acidobacteria bacterium]|nr:permease [Acidobacteriota bacterium]
MDSKSGTARPGASPGNNPAQAGGGSWRKIKKYTLHHLEEDSIIKEIREAPLQRNTVASILTLVLVVLAALFIYKWSGAVGAVGMVQSTGAYGPPPELIATVGLPLLAVSVAKTINYLAVIWPALVFGVLIAGLVRAFVSTELVVRLLGSGVVRQQLLAGAVGMPLMLCSCCIAPVFSSVRAGGVPLGASLALMFSSPLLNVAALILTFMLFPLDVALARAVMAAFAVFVLPVLIERGLGGNIPTGPHRGKTDSLEGFATGGPIPVLRSWIVSLGKVAAQTLPWILLGVFASSVLAGLLEHSEDHWPNLGLTIALVAAFATLMALPTFFEIPLGLLLLQNGFPAAAVVSLLFAGPAINTPSLITLARASSGKVAFVVFLGVWLTATLGGLSLAFWRM